MQDTSEKDVNSFAISLSGGWFVSEIYGICTSISGAKLFTFEQAYWYCEILQVKAIIFDSKTYTKD